jgi:radical SAM-linked protein
MPFPEPLRLRVQVVKEGPARYLSHAEFSRALMFAARRSGLPLEYAGKFRARMKISLSPPIPIGVSSECELVDFQLNGYVPPADAQQALDGSLPAGLRVARCRLMGAEERPVGKLVDTASYLVSLPGEAGSRADWERAAAEFMAEDSVDFERVQPRRTRVIDLRPGVHALEVKEGEGSGADGPVVLAMELDDGTRGTIKPWEVVEVLAGTAGVPRERWRLARVHRNGLFTRIGDRLVSPMELGKRKPAVTRRGGRQY